MFDVGTNWTIQVTGDNLTDEVGLTEEQSAHRRRLGLGSATFIWCVRCSAARSWGRSRIAGPDRDLRSLRLAVSAVRVDTARHDSASSQGCLHGCLVGWRDGRVGSGGRAHAGRCVWGAVQGCAAQGRVPRQQVVHRRAAQPPARTDPERVSRAQGQARLRPEEVRRRTLYVAAQCRFDFHTVAGQDVRQHIDALWKVLERKPEDQRPYTSRIALPHRYIVPGGRFNEIYYWDSYFTMQGLEESGRHDLTMDMIANFGWLIDQYGHIPNGNRSYFLSRSQPPFFAAMIELAADEEGSRFIRNICRSWFVSISSGWMARTPSRRALPIAVPSSSLMALC